MNKTNQLISKLNENHEDFEWYPTSEEMLLPIFKSLPHQIDSILDIGAGTCTFKTYFEKYSLELLNKSNIEEDRKFKEAESKGERYYQRPIDKPVIHKYYAIEKSKILINNFDKDVIVLGTDFHHSFLIDKKVDYIFCNPPYSEYEQWTNRIISEANCFKVFLIIPQRWKDNEKIQNTIDRTKASVNVLGSFDFLNADRSARAKVDVIEIKLKGKYDRVGDINEKAFDEWFNNTFDFKDETEEKLSEYDKEQEKKKELKNKLTTSKNKAELLVQFYNEEIETLFNHFKAICSMDAEVLKTIGVSKDGIKEAIKQKTKSLKIIYWEMAFDELEEITSRLTTKTKSDMLDKFKEIMTIEFNVDNIYALVIWVIKNANSYYNEQLIDFYKSLSNRKNVIPYKSNQKIFDNDRWRHARYDNITHYTLDYRIVCSYVFKTRGWDDKKLDEWENPKVLNDICAIANNLGFVSSPYRDNPTEFGKQYKVYMTNGKLLFDYRIYKNGNTHIRLNMEFAKAMNVEVSRLLGWIRTSDDIKKEFDNNMASGAEKYFKINQLLPVSDGVKLLN